ncbi:hypothetical protein E2C01_074847 [Portunus trituberculatus]|uniref:Uncharacterized protein n=1 Tax=Portunus trituberculatus TaxID=210409 RepID=A0A5B7IDB1_PORTR|nr:hypothetical protein [Portunus trituberculatus]
MLCSLIPPSNRNTILRSRSPPSLWNQTFSTSKSFPRSPFSFARGRCGKTRHGRGGGGPR